MRFHLPQGGSLPLPQPLVATPLVGLYHTVTRGSFIVLFGSFIISNDYKISRADIDLKY